jgi:hypothetical protein
MTDSPLNAPIPVVLISGLKNSGKNTFGYLFQKQLEANLGWATATTAFADPIKRVVREVCGVPDHVLWGNSDLKENTFVYGKSVRHILQWLGTEVFRDHLSLDIWVDATIRHIKRSSGIAAWTITDCRFPNEWLRCKEAFSEGTSFRPFLVKVVRDSSNNSGDVHRSETEIAKLDAFDPIIVDNNGDIEQLAQTAHSVATSIAGNILLKQEACVA